MMDQTIIDCADHGELDREDDRSIHAYLESDDKTCPTCGTDLAEIERGEPAWPLLAVADHVRECGEARYCHKCDSTDGFTRAHVARTR